MLRRLLLIAVAALSLAACTGTHRSAQPDVTALRQTGINAQLAKDGVVPAPMKSGTTKESITLTVAPGTKIGFAIACSGGGNLPVYLDGHQITLTNCGSTDTYTVTAGGSLTAPSGSTTLTLTLAPAPGQRWWAALSAAVHVS